MPEHKKESAALKGRQQIASFLGQPTSVAQRWAKSRMPITRVDRSGDASPEELTRWLGRESTEEPIHIATESDDSSSEVKRGLSFVRERGNVGKKKQSFRAALQCSVCKARVAIDRHEVIVLYSALGSHTRAFPSRCGHAGQSHFLLDPR
jgi:hypothetical protein